MEYLTIPENPVLSGKKAIKALHDFVNELEKQETKEFTDKQTAALNKFAKALISSIEAEMQSSTSDNNAERSRFGKRVLIRLRRAR